MLLANHKSQAATIANPLVLFPVKPETTNAKFITLMWHIILVHTDVT